jgi:hypothetical protein
VKKVKYEFIFHFSGDERTLKRCKKMQPLRNLNQFLIESDQKMHRSYTMAPSKNKAAIKEKTC